ncbi:MULTISPECIES: PIN domain-containing protein [unclassified Sphingopyxis]|uniref:PIN domain-containing protein n=1 Tax=unclassified Sphingopyxis TaxID=2614943 RepID=UPI000736559A|nr:MULTISPECIES: PIN domain-containing protein [unclassified Sphingopyxis]KTE40752.1 twitching motility protein PilT [Sphingopyxis sp. HIX]KTE83920.1 twitching motility protein PilT [Sphingopyxis sp. HXXIV]
MYLLDAEVLLDLRHTPDGAPLAAWAQRVSRQAMFVSALSLVELENAAALAQKQGKAADAAWRAWIDERLLPAFEGRIVAVDQAVARRRATLAIEQDRDALLAATALEHGLTLVTYHPTTFRTARLKLLDPSRAAPEAADDGDWREATRGRAPWLKNLFIRG